MLFGILNVKLVSHFSPTFTSSFHIFQGEKCERRPQRLIALVHIPLSSMFFPVHMAMNVDLAHKCLPGSFVPL